MTRHSSSSSRHTQSSSSQRGGGGSEDNRRSSSKHSRSTSSRQTSSKNSSRSTRSPSQSTSGNNNGSTFSYGPAGQPKKHLNIVADHSTDDSDNSSDEIAREERTGWAKYATFFGIGAFIVGVIIAVVTTYLLMKANAATNNSKKNPKKVGNTSPNPTVAPVVIVPTANPTFAPTGMPTVEYPPPDLQVCQALKEGKDIQSIYPSSSEDLLERNMDISFDITIRPGGPFRTEEELIEYFPKQVESALIPTLAGCEDVRGFGRKLGAQDRELLLSAELEQIRYVIAGGHVSGTKYNEITCPAENTGQLVTCFNVIVYFEFFLNGDEAVFQVLSLITNILTEMSSSSTMVSNFKLPNPPFQKVVANGVRNNDPTVSPSVSPTLFPTDKPSATPSVAPTNRPSVPPTGSPSGAPSASPSAAPSMSPTKGPTKSPTLEPSKSPTTVPSTRPTGQPSPAPSASPSGAPSSSPSLVPTISNAPSLSAAPSDAPSISNAPTSRINYIIGVLPPTWTDTFVIDWLANIDTWWSPDAATAEDEEAIWAERYTLVLFSKYVGNLARSGSSHCGWTNITCDADGRVKGLELPYNDIRGGIPTELSAFSEMTKLDLSHNTYTGTTIPTELFALSKLEYLDISSSGIAGTIPTQISSMASLREMHLNSNNLVGTIPSLPELVQRNRDDVITLGSGVTVASICEMYGNELQMTTVSTANAGGCDLVRTASDSSSSSSTSDDSTSSSAAPVTRFRYLSVFQRRGPRGLEEEESSSSDDEDEDMDSFRKFASPVYNQVRAPHAQNEKKIKNLKKLKNKALMRKHTKRAKKHGFLEKTGKEMTAEFLKAQFREEQEQEQ